MLKILNYISHHAIAILALICSLLALAGASYAALSVPAGAVGARQLRDNSITPEKFNHRQINGAVRAWAIVGASGHLIAGGGRPVIRRNPTFPGVLRSLGGKSPARVRVGRDDQRQSVAEDRAAADQPDGRLRGAGELVHR